MVVFATTLALAVGVQWSSGAYTSDFDAHPDEPAHVVSSLLVRDYLTQDLPHNPLAFARDYYAHFPKVAIGHWPPLFHASTAAWMLIFGRSRAAIVVWMAVLCAILTTTVFSWVRRECGLPTAAFAAGVLFASPTIYESVPSVMLDILLALLAFAAAAAWGAFLQSGAKRYAVWFAVFIGLAVGTNGRGFAIALLVVPTGVMLLRARDWRWLAALVATIAIMIAPNFLPDAPPFSVGAFFFSFWHFLVRLIVVVSWPVMALAIIGAVSVFRHRHENRRWMPMLGLSAVMWMFFSLSNWAVEDRYVLTTAPAVASLAAVGCRWCFDRFRLPLRVAALVLCAGVAVAFDVSHYAAKSDLGYHIFARQRFVQAHATSLIAGDSIHEGAYTAEMALLDPGRVHTVLRGTKVLSQSTWGGNCYRMLFASPGEVDAWLNGTDVTLVIIQTKGRPHLPQLLEALRGDAGRWRELPAAVYPREVRVFERVPQ